jgi:hypothetical protein
MDRLSRLEDTLQNLLVSDETKSTVQELLNSHAKVADAAHEMMLLQLRITRLLWDNRLLYNQLENSSTKYSSDEIVLPELLEQVLIHCFGGTYDRGDLLNQLGCSKEELNFAIDHLKDLAFIIEVTAKNGQDGGVRSTALGQRYVADRGINLAN